MGLTQWWFSHQPTRGRYILENVPPLGDTRKNILEDGKYIHQLLGRLTFVDVAALGSNPHHTRWIWTNLAPSHVLTAALSRVTTPTT